MSEDDRFDGEGTEPPGGGLTAPWEDDLGGSDAGESTDGTDRSGGEGGADDRTDAHREDRSEETGEDPASGDATASGGAAPAAGDGDAAIGSLRRLAFLVPRVLALVLLVGLPGAVVYVLMVQYFELAPLYRVIGLLGIAFLARWLLRPHVGTFLTPPAERE